MDIPTDLTPDQIRTLEEMVRTSSWYSNDPSLFPLRPDEQPLLEKIKTYFADYPECVVERIPCDVTHGRYMTASIESKVLSEFALPPSLILPGHIDHLRSSITQLFKDIGVSPITISLSQKELLKRESLLVTKGTGTEFTILLYTHIDTVRAAKGFEHPYDLRRDGDKLHGLGAYDMKAGAMLLVDVMRNVTVPPNVKLIAAFCPDEEKDSAGVTSLLRHRPLREVDLVLSPEIATLHDQQEEDSPKDIIANRVGHTKFIVRVNVPQGHLYNKGILQASVIHKQIDEHLEKSFQPRKHPHFGDMEERLYTREEVVSKVEGYSNTTDAFHRYGCITLPPSSIAAMVQSQFNLVQQLAEQKDWARQKINFSLKLDRTGTSYEPYTVNIHSAAAQTVLHAAEKYYGGYKLKAGASTSDANILVPHFAEMERDAPVLEIGPVGGGAHAKEEYVSVSSLAKCIGFYRYLIEQHIPEFLAERA